MRLCPRLRSRLWRAASAAALLAATLAAAPPVLAAPAITNGGFESGLTGWTVVNQAGSAGSFQLQTGTSSPLSGFPVPAPTGGANAAMTDSDGPGSHLLYQDFVAVAGNATLSFDL